MASATTLCFKDGREGLGRSLQTQAVRTLSVDGVCAGWLVAVLLPWLLLSGDPLRRSHDMRMPGCAAGSWADFVIFVFGCGGSRKEVAAVHGRSAAERPAATGDAFDPAKPPLLLQHGDLSRGVFFFAAGSGGGSGGSVTTRDSDDACSGRNSAAGGFGASSSEASSRQHSSSSTAVVAVGKIEPVFCTTNEAAVGIARNNNNHKIVGGGKKSIPKEAEGPRIRDGGALALEGETGGDKSSSAGQQQPKEGQQQQLRQRRAKPSYR